MVLKLHIQKCLFWLQNEYNFGTLLKQAINLCKKVKMCYSLDYGRSIVLFIIYSELIIYCRSIISFGKKLRIATWHSYSKFLAVRDNTR